MDKLDKFLISSLARKGLAGAATSAQICFYASEWKLVRFKPMAFSGGILKVSVTSSAAASELQLREEKLIDFINGKLKKEMVKRLRIINLS